MFNKLFVSLGIAFQNIRRNLFHTLLSIIGVVIGVAALVSILSLIDGMEKSIREGITDIISLQSVEVETDLTKNINGIEVRRESIPVVTVQQIRELRDDVGGIALATLQKSFNSRLYLLGQTDTLAGSVYGKWKSIADTSQKTLVAGRLLTPEETGSTQPIAIVNEELAKESDLKPQALLDKSLKIRQQQFNIVGVVRDSTAEGVQVRIPVLAMDKTYPDFEPPEFQLEAEKFEHVDAIKQKVSDWLKQEFQTDGEVFSVRSTQMFFEQASKGILFFKIFMGVIVGISVIVGGVGIMNVLLISVRERTKEIGIRKAVGARKKDIGLQFLSESITISLLGSTIGLILGIVGTFSLVAIVGAIYDIGGYEPVFTLSTLIVVVIVAVILGVIFGTYPAMKASRLAPVDAIRRE